ncbi:MAG: flagellar protein FlgN [Gemmatimonadales bacterium]|nr:MAG: flagellar protein FlgN [Gemmatimonadales bacterium]
MMNAAPLFEDATMLEPMPAPMPAAGWTGRLLDCLQSETALLRQLEGILQAQRDAVETADLDTLEQNTYQARRVLRTLTEARRRRAGVLEVGLGRTDVTLDELERRGIPVGQDLMEARSDLRRTARRVEIALKLNSRLLTEASRTNDQAARTLLGGDTPSATWHPRGTRSSGSGRHLNRRV